MIEIAKLAGFCGGVTNSVNKTELALKEYKKLYCLGELVHNSRVVNDLIDKGLTIIKNLDEVEDNSNVIIRAHGVEQDVYEIAKLRNINLIDLTCPKVLKIHELVNSYAFKNYYIILVGNKEHPEVIGTKSFCGLYSSIIEDINELDSIYDNLKEFNKILVLAQTTFNESLFLEIVDKIKKDLNDKNIEIKNTICNATHLRQEECKNMAINKECMIIIGGKHSSNTIKLYEISKKYCNNTFFIEDKDELDLNEINKYKDIGIMAGASTPEVLIKEVISKIKENSN